MRFKYALSTSLLKSCAPALLALFIAACETTPAPPPPPQIVYAPAPEPVVYAPPPVIVAPLSVPQRSADVRMNETLVRSAASHAGVMRRVTRAAATPISSKDDLNRMMDDLTVLFSPTLGAGMTSYGALVATQNTQFVDSVLDKAQSDGLDSVVYQLYASPDYATQFSGSYGAAADVAAAWQEDISVIRSAGAQIKQQSYSLQKQPTWKKQRADSRKERIAALKSSRNILASIDSTSQRDIAAAGAVSSRDFDGPERTAAFWRAYSKSGVSPGTATPRMSQRMKRALTLAALDTLGATDGKSSAWIANYTTTPVLNQCTNWARLHTEQCLAAGHYKYEDAYCIAEHQLTDGSECLSKSGY